ncbi:excalibur calcium-binding domain-containing protein [Streptomyces sp. NPDC053431]|uniref:excalibur calcium-binding domain-containing protein n=1 Tax=Streptomyces sp. NPDC053431 TaxID=3365703 RepID=UPI0037D70AE7
MNRRTHVGASSLLLTALLGVSGCGGGESTPARNATTVTETVTEPATPPPPSTTPAPAPTSPEPVSPWPTNPPTTADASAVVRTYFAAINAKDYRRAWDLGGKNLSGSYSAFADGFAATAHDTVHILGTAGDTVSVRLEAAQADGSLRIYEGTYTVRGGTIVGADVHEVTRPERPPSPYYEDCDEARAAGAAPIHRGEPGYAPHLDRDGDGVACEPYPP